MYEMYNSKLAGEAAEIIRVQRCNLCEQLVLHTKIRVCHPLPRTPTKKGGSI